ncbi:MAG: hypothetical protein ABTQ27_17290 [Amaricoccus sp.]|uniref:hypothetical protein n=1 Tax=Amaricoccus sp. TaxID=1872485 RepID=UPI0033161E10
MGDPVTQAGAPALTLRQRAVAAFRRFLVLFLYLWALFALFVLNEGALARSHGSPVVLQGFALLNALVLAKVMLVAEHFDFSRGLRRRPRVYAVLFDAALCTALFMVFHIAERVVAGKLRGESLSASMPSFGGGGLAGVLIVSAIAFVSLLPFFTFKHVSRAVGPDRMKAILLAPPDTSAGDERPSPSHAL